MSLNKSHLSSLNFFLSNIENLNEYERDKFLRSYQKNLLSHSMLANDVSLSYKPIKSYIKNDLIAYKLVLEETVWVIAKSIQFGFPILVVMDEYLENKIWSVNTKPLSNIEIERDLQKFKKELEKTDVGSNENHKTEVLIQLGHANFAHFMWNELPAFQELTKHKFFRNVKVSFMNEPIEIRHSGLIPEDVKISPAISGLTGSIVVRPGGQKIDQITIDFLKDVIADKKENKRNFDADLNIWITVRIDGRTCINQAEFIKKAILYIEKHEPHKKIRFIFDGFSFPDDFNNDNYDAQRNRFVKRSEEVEEYIKKLVLDIKSNIKNTDKICLQTTSGLSVSRALSLSKYVDFYISHFGSIQHKVAWLYNPPGFIHSNRSSISSAAQKWLNDMTCNQNKSFFIEDKYIEDVQSIRLAAQVERNKDYNILCSDELFSKILSKIVNKE